MTGLLSNPHFSRHIMKALSNRDVPKKDDKYFKLIAAFSCIAADELIERLKKS